LTEGEDRELERDNVGEGGEIFEETGTIVNGGQVIRFSENGVVNIARDGALNALIKFLGVLLSPVVDTNSVGSLELNSLML